MFLQISNSFHNPNQQHNINYHIVKPNNTIPKISWTCQGTCYQSYCYPLGIHKYLLLEFIFFCGEGVGVGWGVGGGGWSILKSSSILKTLSYFCSRQDYRRTAGLRWRRYVRELLTGSQTFASQLLGGIVWISDPNLDLALKNV